LATRGLRPLRQLGQNFLAEPALATVIAHTLPKAKSEPVQEIGPGLGALTRALLTIGHSVEAFEIDHGLISWLREEFEKEPRFQLIEGDALKTLPQHPPRAHVCGNLPYSISTPLLVQLALRSPPPEVIVVTLQKEVADRYSALPRTSEYGAVSVLLQSVFDIEKIRNLPPEVFYPRPQVDSANIPDRPRAFPRFCQKGLLPKKKETERTSLCKPRPPGRRAQSYRMAHSL
jgi:16S rRNA (adenine1518-N6/adenine1519-N6)-dimethyltransferase